MQKSFFFVFLSLLGLMGTGQDAVVWVTFDLLCCASFS